MLAAGLTLLAAAPSWAAVSCTASAGGVAFGAYDPLLATADDSTGSIVVSCTYTPPGTSSVSYTVALSPGTGGTYAQRRMAAGTSRLNYNLFRNTARSQVWGNGGSGTVIASGTFSLSTGTPTRQRTHTVYGRIPALQDVAPGNYVDSIVVTLTF